MNNDLPTFQPNKVESIEGCPLLTLNTKQLIAQHAHDYKYIRTVLMQHATPEQQINFTVILGYLETICTQYSQQDFLNALDRMSEKSIGTSSQDYASSKLENLSSFTSFLIELKNANITSAEMRKDTWCNRVLTNPSFLKSLANLASNTLGDANSIFTRNADNLGANIHMLDADNPTEEVTVYDGVYESLVLFIVIQDRTASLIMKKDIQPNYDLLLKPSELSDCQEDSNVLRKKLGDSNIRIASLEAENSELKKKIMECMQHIQQCANKDQENMKEIVNKNNIIAELNASIEAIKKKLQEIESNLNESKENDTETLKHQLENANKNINSKLETIQKLNDELNIIRNNYINKENEMKNTNLTKEKEIQNMQKEIAKLKKDIERLMSLQNNKGNSQEAEELNKKLQIQEQENIKHKTEISNLQERIKMLLNEIEELKKKLKITENTKDSYIADLQSQIQELKILIEKLKKQAESTCTDKNKEKDDASMNYFNIVIVKMNNEIKQLKELILKLRKYSYITEAKIDEVKKIEISKQNVRVECGLPHICSMCKDPATMKHTFKFGQCTNCYFCIKCIRGMRYKYTKCPSCNIDFTYEDFLQIQALTN